MGGNADEQDWSGKQVFSTGEAAQICKVSQQTIIRCFDSGRLQGFRVPGSKFRRIPRDELIRFMRANGMPVDLLEGRLRKVLFVGDAPSPIEMMIDRFSSKPWIEIRRAVSAFDAGMQAVHAKPHLLFVDHRVRGVSVTLLRERFAEMGLSGIPLVVYVGRFNEHGDRDERLKAGASGVIELPMPDTELERVMLDWIERAQGM
ncbi:MAG TPA: helix-turn-helix domain-containing protein [Phycisphaerales bacterium]|nr:helix-turn-helix domain-containing protein [Phycisphaerales bacterium]